MSWGPAWKYVPCEQFLYHAGTIANWADNATYFTEMFPAWLLYHCVSTVAVHHTTVSKKWWLVVPSEKITTQSLLRYAEDVDECHVGVEPISDSWVSWHKQTYGSEPYLTSVMCSLCCYCYSPSPNLCFKTVVAWFVPFTNCLSSLGFLWMVMQILVENLANAAIR
jgi:hypothetical protein